jgi:hypothetical protein
MKAVYPFQRTAECYIQKIALFINKQLIGSGTDNNYILFNVEQFCLSISLFSLSWSDLRVIQKYMQM